MCAEKLDRLNSDVKKEPLRIEDGVLIVDAIRFEEIDKNKINQAVSEAKMVVIDLRDTEFPKSYDIDDFQAFMEGLFSRMVATNLNTASLHYRCLVPKCDGVKCTSSSNKELLWDKFYMAAPARLRHCVEQYKIVKKA